jgi:hypothetical protein
MPAGTALITDFKPESNNEGVSVKSLLEAINKHCGHLAEE